MDGVVLCTRLWPVVGATCASSSESGENIKAGTENQQWMMLALCVLSAAVLEMYSV